VKALSVLDAQADFRGWGGEAMQQAGVQLVRHYREMSFMGFLEVLQNLRTIRRLLRECQDDIAQWQPDVVILVDFAGFNLRIARFAKKQNFRTFYYISPKIWAWNQKRAYKIKRLVDRMFVILHFEKAFYERYDYAVDYVGNPLFDAVSAFQPAADFRARHTLGERPLIALLPGSRVQEIRQMLPVMLAVVPHFPHYQFVVAGVSHLPESLYKEVRKAGLPLVFDATYDLLHHAEAALVTSGTATLETALFRVPQVVCYRTSWLSYQIGRQVIAVSFISLVNLIADRKVVPELIQHECRPQRLREELARALGEGRASMLEGYETVIERTGTEGASERTAQLMWQYLQEPSVSHEGEGHP
jgi:lipid-A-disaccharide synthase